MVKKVKKDKARVSGKEEKLDLQVELLRDVVKQIAGEGAEAIVDLLYKKKNVNEFLIAKKLEKTINQTRNILYKLADSGLVSFIRKKDSKKGGWYTYFWTLNAYKSLELLRNQLENALEKFDEDIRKRENERFYYSEGADLEYTEEEALGHDFICPETGDVMVLRDNSEIVKVFKERRVIMKDLLNRTINEMEILEKKEGQSRDRRLKAEAKKKEEERRERRKKLQRQKKREAAKSGKVRKTKTKKGKKAKKSKKVKKKSKKTRKVVKKKSKKSKKAGKVKKKVKKKSSKKKK